MMNNLQDNRHCKKIYMYMHSLHQTSLIEVEMVLCLVIIHLTLASGSLQILHEFIMV